MTERLLGDIEPPSSGRDEYRDAAISGLVLRVTAAGTKTWAFQYRHNGRNQRVTIGKHPALSLKVARDRARTIAGEVAFDKNPAAAKRKEREGRKTARVQEVIDEFIDRKQKPNTRDWHNVQRNLNTHFGRFAHKLANELRLDQVLSVTDGLVENGKPHAANNARYAIQSAYRFAAERKLVDANHELCNIPRPFKFNPIKHGRKRLLSEGEIQSLWRALDSMGAEASPATNGKRSPRSWAAAAVAYKILLLTGQRKNEIAASRASWWRLSDGDSLSCLDLPPEATKNGIAHLVPLSPPVVELIEQMLPSRNTDGYAFSSDGGRTHIALGSKHKRFLDEKVKPQTPWVIHDLRRTVATGMRRIGVTSDVVEHVLNHRQASVRDIYDLHDQLPERRKALNRWAEFVIDLVHCD